MKLDKLTRWRHFLGRRFRPRQMELRKWIHRSGQLPDFLIIGAMKSGTTSLYCMLEQHPGFVPALVKEVQFFNNPRNWARGEAWYRAHFPSADTMQARSAQLGYRALTAEATPAMSTPIYAENAARLVPEARLIVSLRNPVERAWSHYQHMRRHPIPEKLGFAAAIEQDLAWRHQGLRLTADNHGRLAGRLVKRGYVHRGYYAEQLEHWLRHFPREQFLIMNFDTWKTEPSESIGRITRFVGLPDHAFRDHRANVGRYTEPMPDDCRDFLVDHYRPHNRRLFELLGENWGWPS